MTAVQRGGGLQSAVQRGGGLQSAVNVRSGGLETAAPLASPRYFDPNVEIDIHGSRLPHWDQSSTLCFVTFRLADSLPQEKLAGFVARRDAWISVHALFAPMLGQNIAGIVKTWKSFSARRINALRGISGPLWQRNYWDTLIRNAKHHRRVRKYIFDNSPTLARISKRGGGLQSAVNVRSGGLETAAPLADASVPAAPLADVHLI